MCKEFLSLHVGQAGVQSSQALWELVCIEHGIGPDGILRNKSEDGYTGENIEVMYYEIKNSRFVPRAILMDLEPTVVDEVRMGSYRDLWNPANLLNQKEDAASNYARGFYTSGKSFQTAAVDRINRELERCDNVSAFEIVHSFAGGTGSGFTALLYETIGEFYGKKFKFSLGVFPSPTLSELMVETYNSVLHTNSTLETEDCVVTFDNESLFNTSLKKLNVSQPTFSLMNRLLSQMFSSISLSHRYTFFGSQHADVTELLTNLVPYPRIHFPIMSYSPLIPFSQQNHEQFNCSRLTNDVFHDDSHVLQCSLNDNKFMSCCMLYRGTISPKPVIDAIAKIKGSRNITFVDWCPTGFKIGINTCPPIQIPHCEQAIGDNALCMISGNTAIRTCWAVVIKKFDMLMSKRAFVHWYVAEGLEEGEFLDARDNIQSLILDYEELSSSTIDERAVDLIPSDGKTPSKNSNVNSNNTTPFNDLDRLTPDLNAPKKQKYKYNHTFYPEKLDDANRSQKPSLRMVAKSSKDRDRNQSAISSKDSYSNKTVKRILTNCKKMVNNDCALGNDTNKRKKEKSRHDRFATKNVEVKQIGRTVVKYIEHNGKELVLSNSCSSCNSEILDSFLMMRNNNKGKSLVDSISTGSFKTAVESQNKTSISFIRKSKGKLRVIDQLLNNSSGKKDLNRFQISEGLGKRFVRMETDESNSSSHSVDKTYISTKRPPSVDLIPKVDKIMCVIEESKKPTKTSANMDTGISQDFRRSNLNFKQLEVVICEPYFSL